MKQTICILLSAIAISLGCSAKKQTSTFPDGTPISSWFADTTGVELKDMGKPYIITDYGVVNDSTIIQTQKIQEVIDRCHANTSLGRRASKLVHFLMTFRRSQNSS